MMEMSNLKVPIIVVIIGEASSGGALAIGVGDRIIMLENAIYSVLSPEGYASILWKDATKAKEVAEKMKLTSKDLYDLKVIDKIIEEPAGGAEKDKNMVASKIKEEIIKTLYELKKKDVEILLDERYNKFRNMGEYI